MEEKEKRLTSPEELEVGLCAQIRGEIHLSTVLQFVQ
jgi:hypothetical protein